MQVTAEVDAHDVATEMRVDGEWAMDVLSAMAEDGDRTIKEIAEAGIVSEWNDPVPAFLRKLADALDESANKG